MEHYDWLMFLTIIILVLYVVEPLGTLVIVGLVFLVIHYICKCVLTSTCQYKMKNEDLEESQHIIAKDQSVIIDINDKIKTEVEPS